MEIQWKTLEEDVDIILHNRRNIELILGSVMGLFKAFIENNFELVAEGKLDVAEDGFIVIRDGIRLDEIIKNKDIKFYNNIKIFISKANK